MLTQQHHDFNWWQSTALAEDVYKVCEAQLEKCRDHINTKIQKEIKEEKKGQQTKINWEEAVKHYYSIQTLRIGIHERYWSKGMSKADSKHLNRICKLLQGIENAAYKLTKEEKEVDR